MKKMITWSFVLAVVLAPVLFAEDAKPQAPAKTEGKHGICLTCPAEKLGRGVSNVVFSPLEIPLRVGKDMEQMDPIAAFFSGSLKGVAWGCARLVAGAFDIATFVIPTRPMISEFDAGWWSA